MLVLTHRGDETVVKTPPEDWPFDQAPNVASITTVGVIERRLPILRVTHYGDDNSWAFLCGTTDADEDGRVIGMGTALSLDPTLRTIADLAPGWTAWRDRVGGTWQRWPEAEAEQTDQPERAPPS
jgi:hypothetical protein